MSEKKSGTRGKRPPSAPAMRLRRALADNVQARMDDAYPLQTPRGKAAQQKKFAKDAGVSWSSIQRAVDAEKGKTLDLVADLAAGLEVKVTDLLAPGNGPAAPPPFGQLSREGIASPPARSSRKPRY